MPAMPAMHLEVQVAAAANVGLVVQVVLHILLGCSETGQKAPRQHTGTLAD